MHPYLAGIALAEASVALRNAGDSTGADVLARELMEKYPYHPVVDWPLFRSAAPARTPAPLTAPNKPAEATPPPSQDAKQEPK